MKLIFKPLFQKYLLFCFKNTFVVSVIIIIEQANIFVCLLDQLQSLFSESMSEEVKKALGGVSKFSVIYFIKSFITYNSLTGLNEMDNTINYLQIFLTVFILMFFGLFIIEEVFIFNQNEDNITERIKNNSEVTVSSYQFLFDSLSYFFVNLLDFIIHFCSLGIFFLNFHLILAFFRKLEFYLNFNYNIQNLQLASLANSALDYQTIIFLTLGIAFLGFYLYIYLSFIKNVNLIIQYNKELSTHYDHIFSVNFDLFMLALKILIAIDSALDINRLSTDNTSKFSKIAIVFIFAFYVLSKIFSNFVMKSILYLSNHKFNILRLFLINFFGFTIILIVPFAAIIFRDLQSLIIALVIGLIIAVFVCYVININNFIAIYTSENYILQLIYMLNIKYNSGDKQIMTELSNLIFYHKNYCRNYRDCLICKLKGFTFDEFLHSYYMQIKRVFKNKSLKHLLFSSRDISVFDLIKLLIIENLDKNKIIKLIYKAKRILEKYEVRKRFDNVYFNILIYNLYMKKLITRNQTLKFKIIQCYEDTSLFIGQALSLIDTVLISLNNGEKQIFVKSSNLFDMKNKISKNVLFLSYYQNYFVDTYSIIIYRFIYKNLFNCDINDYITVYNVEEIKDLINYMFDHEKLIHVKLDFKNNSMRISRIGKDLIDYRNKSLDDLIPIDFKDHFCHELIKTIKTSDNEENKLFEYIITDEQNNLKSIKINFTVLASFKLDKVFLIGTYETIDENLILLKDINENAFKNQDVTADASVNIINLKNADNAVNMIKATFGAPNNENENINTNNINKNLIEETLLYKINKNDDADRNINNRSDNTLDMLYHKTKSLVESNMQYKENVNKIKHKKLKYNSIMKYQKEKILFNYDGLHQGVSSPIEKNKNKQNCSYNSKDLKANKSTNHAKSHNNTNNSKKKKLKTKNGNYKKETDSNLSLNSNELNNDQFNNELDQSINKHFYNLEIKYFSNNFSDIFFLKANWLNKIKARYNFPLQDIFEMIPLNNLNSNVNPTKGQLGPAKIDDDSLKLNIFRINYNKYYSIFIKLMNYVEEEMSSEEISLNMKKFRAICKANKFAYFKFENFYNLEMKEKFYSLYKIKPIKAGDNLLESFNIEKSTDDSYTHPDFDDKELENYDMKKIDTLIQEKDTTTLSSSAASSISSSNKFMEQDSSRRHISNNEQRMNKFTIFSLLFCIFLIIYCLFFLIIGLQNNTNIRKLYTIRNSFNDFRYFFYHTSLNLFFNFEIELPTQEQHQPQASSASSGGYSSLLSNSSASSAKLGTSLNVEFFNSKFGGNKAITINFSKFIVEELSIKLNMLRDIYTELKNAIFSSIYRSSLDIIFNIENDFYQINKVADELSVTYTKKYFFETINLFFNHGKVIVETISKNNAIKLYIINAKNNKIDFSSIPNQADLSDIQLKMYELAINYVNYYKNLIEIGDLMNEYFTEALTEVFNSTYLLSYILMGLHLFLFLGGMLIIKFLYKIISQNDRMLSISNEDDNLKFMRDKLRSIANLNLLFVENPKNLFLSLNKKRREYIKKISAEKEKKNKLKFKSKDNTRLTRENNNFDIYHDINIAEQVYSNFSGETELMINSSLSQYKRNKSSSYLDKLEILIPFVYLFMILFMIYYTYSLIFYFLFQGSYNDFISTSDFQNHNIDLDNKIMNNINLLSVMMVLNKTEFDLAYDIYGNKEMLMMELLTNILTTRTTITKYKKTNAKFRELDDMETTLMNCSFIYNNLNDTILFNLEDNYERDLSVRSSLAEICSKYPFMGTKKLDSIFDEVSYSSLHLYNLYDTCDKSYAAIKTVHENSMFYDLFLVLLVIFRPIRKYSSDYIFENIIMLSSSNYLIFTIIYLILNIIVDLMICYIINNLVVKKISDINKHLTNMITCVCFKFSNNSKKEKQIK